MHPRITEGEAFLAAGGVGAVRHYKIQMAAARRHDLAPVWISSRDGQILMDQRNDGGTFSDRAAYALHGARTHVADGEHARHVRLERGGQPTPRVACAGITRE